MQRDAAKEGRAGRAPLERRSSGWTSVKDDCASKNEFRTQSDNQIDVEIFEYVHLTVCVSQGTCPGQGCVKERGRVVGGRWVGWVVKTI